MDTLNWESQEVLNYLTNDIEQLATVKGLTAAVLEKYCISGLAPEGLYTSFNKEPVSNWWDVNWNAVAERINDL